MCGIAGVYSAKLDDYLYATVQAVIDDQTPRGPDYQAVSFINDKLIFGHNRLSIVDLSSEANQPMWDNSKKYCISYNGEIYNYVELRNELEQLGCIFNTQSDTEVILNSFKQWGVAALERFNGPFAFAIFEKDTNKLWLCRDRFGVKPLYYIFKNSNLFFASTPTVLAKQLKLPPNLDYVERGIRQWVYEDDTDIAPYQQLKQLLAGCYLEISLRSSTDFSQSLVRYYDLVERVHRVQNQLRTLSTADLLQQGLEYLQRAIVLRLRADVPVGVTLSGGLDSSSIAALASVQHPEVLGFSFGHPDAKASEGPLVKQLSEKIRLKVDYIWPTTEELSAALFKTLKVQGAPFASMSVVAQYLVYQRARERGIKVLLGGQGGDEAFMGYRKFNLFWAKQLLHQKKYFGALHFFCQLFPMIWAELGQFKNYWQHLNRYQNKKNHSFQDILRLPKETSLALGYRAEDGIKLRQLHDITRFSLPTLLRYEDRNSLGNTVESRLPFLDYHIIEYGLALPEVLKLNKGYGKWIVREWMQDKIPESIRAARYKRGFDVSADTTLISHLGNVIRQTLQDKKTAIEPFLMRGIDISTSFSDECFKSRRATFAEALSLIWLGNHI